jgi:hypothetical protein
LTAIVEPSAEGSQRKWLVLVFALAILLQLELVFSRPVNWDEFFHLSEAHAFHQGRLTEALQVLYARAFFWLPMLPLDAVDQIRVARLVMLGFELVTLTAIYAMASRFAGRLPAGLAALAYVTGGYVFEHGFSYRADPMAAALLMGALWILLASRLDAKAILGAALLAGLAALTTIKIILYAPAFAGVAWLRWHEADRSRDMAMRLAACGVAALLFAGLFIGATILSLPDAGGHTAAKTVSTSGMMMFDRGLFPQWGYGVLAVLSAPLLAVVLIVTPFAMGETALSRPQRVALVGLMLPLASLLFYQNAYPYFYAYILPPVMVAAALGIGALIARFPAKALSAALLANALIVSLATPREVLPTQRAVLAAAHEIFPEPVAYFDFPGMIVDFPKANVFMTTWGIRKYRAGHEDSFVDVMARQTVPLLVVNQAQIEQNQSGAGPWEGFLPADGKALREGFIPHWGPLWVAGRRFPADAPAGSFDIYAPGLYTVEGAAVRIDGRLYAVGQTVDLARGAHRFEPGGRGEALLRWGDHLHRPAQAFDGGPLLKDF